MKRQTGNGYDLVPLLSVGVVFVVQVGYLLFPNDSGFSSYTPQPIDLAILLCSFFLCRIVKSQFSRVFILSWLVWYIYGIVSYIAFIARGTQWASTYSPPLSPYSTIYPILLLATALGIVASERLVGFGTSPKKAESGRHLIVLLMLGTFPLAYALSIYLTLGYLPLFSGRAFYAEVYDIEYGPLHALNIVCVCSAIYYAFYFRIFERVSVAFAFHCGIICLMAIAGITDGRRLVALMIFAALGVQFFSDKRPNLKALLTGGSFAVVALFLYVIVHRIRVGAAPEADFSLVDLVASFGVEFRDSIFASALIPRERALDLGYDWTGSTVASLLNGRLLSVFGYDKTSLISHDSARTFMLLFNEKFGIRLGVITELWFAFGYLGGALATFFFGVLVGIVVRLLTGSCDILDRTFLLTIFVSLMFSVIGQSSVTFGIFPTLLYAYLALRVVAWLERAIAPVRQPARPLSR